MKYIFQILLSIYILFKFGISGIVSVIILNLAVIGLLALVDQAGKKALNQEEN